MTTKKPRGHLEVVMPTEIRGWCAAASNDGGAVNVDIFIDDRFHATAAGVGYREDLKRAGVAGGFAAFAIDTPASILDGREHIVTAKFRGTDCHLVGSPRVFKHKDNAFDDRDWADKYASYLVEAQTNAAEKARLKADFQAGGIRKVALLASYSSKTRPFSHCQRLITALNQNGYYVVHIHASAVSQGLARWDPISEADRAFLKHNIGYDFGSWLAGAALIGPWTGMLDEVLILNDSSVGPVFPLQSFLDESRLADCDIYGLIDSYDGQFHLQSCCLRFGKAPLREGFFARFAESYPITRLKDDLSRSGEISLTELAIDYGYRLNTEYSFEIARERWLSSCARYKDEAVWAICEAGFSTFSTVAESIETKFEDIRSDVMCGAPVNPTHYFWRTLCEEFAFPLLKRDLLLKNPAGIPDWHMIPAIFEKRSAASRGMIENAYRESSGLVPFFPKPTRFKASPMDPPVARPLAAAQV